MTNEKTTKMEKSERLVIASLLISILSVLSMILGLIRNSLFASIYGSTAETDAYYIAYNITNALVASLSSCLVSIFYSYYVEKRNKSFKERTDFTSGYVTLIFVISVFVSLCFLFLAPIIVKIVAPSYNEEQTITTVTLLRLFQFFPLFNMITAVLNSILDQNKKYVGAQLFGLIGNILSIFILVFFAEYIGIKAMITAVTISSMVQMIFLLMKTQKVQPLHFDLKCFRRDVLSPLKGMLPLTGGIVLTQIQTVIDSFFASSLGPGSISAISYSSTIVAFVLVLSYTPIKTVIQPELVDRIYSNNSINNVLSKGIGMMLVMLVPCTAGVILLRKEIITILYYRGNFTLEAVYTTSAVLGIYIIGVAFNCILNYYSTVFIAKREYYVTVITGGIALLANITGNVILVRPYGVIGLAISTSIAFFINGFVQIIWLGIRHKCIEFNKTMRSLLKPVAASLVMYAIGYVIQYRFTVNNVYLKSLLIIIPCVFIYVLLLRLMRSNEYTILENIIKNRLQRMNNKFIPERTSEK